MRRTTAVSLYSSAGLGAKKAFLRPPRRIADSFWKTHRARQDHLVSDGAHGLGLSAHCPAESEKISTLLDDYCLAWNWVHQQPSLPASGPLFLGHGRPPTDTGRPDGPGPGPSHSGFGFIAVPRVRIFSGVWTRLGPCALVPVANNAKIKCSLAKNNVVILVPVHTSVSVVLNPINLKCVAS